jgi:hypothetical protein
MLEGDSPTARLCAEGMAVDGDPVAALALFERAWHLHRDAYEAAIAAHFLARHQPSAELTLHWNRVALEHALSLPPPRADALLPSLYLNVGDGYLNSGALDLAAEAATLGLAALGEAPADGYARYDGTGLERLRSRIARRREGEGGTA